MSARPFRHLLFIFFFVSGFCSLLYQIVWTRMAFASFGILTPVLSVVLSVFMLGLAVGAWGGGKLATARSSKNGASALKMYAAAEFLIGVGAFAAPWFFSIGERLLLSTGEMNSITYLSASALILAVSILPWCLCMGATLPFMMACVRERDPENTKSFSYLYLANVLGAMCGTLMTALVLVELLGFHHTLWIAATGNFSIAIIAGSLARNKQALSGLKLDEGRTTSIAAISSTGISKRLTQWILFTTGFSAMAMEVVWTRGFTTVLSTQVYSFAMVIFVYLAATFVGAWLYRRDLRKRAVRSTAELITILFPAVFLPILVDDPRLVAMNAGMQPGSVLALLASIFPLCAILGYLTPCLIDDYAAGEPATAGRAYAINVLGCILGPLLASYVLLPSFSERHALMILGCPFLAFSFLCFNRMRPVVRMVVLPIAVALPVVSMVFSEGFEDQTKAAFKAEIRRDYAASVVCVQGANGKFDKALFINGINITSLTPITKFMVHLPMAFHNGPPSSALIICFGMGTSFRSAMSWKVPTTSVELVPSVKKVFPFFHDDAPEVLAQPNGRIIIDDGRRYLKRTAEKFDVIVIDPPPPVTAAGSSLLYSEEFYALAKQHLNTNGILQTWYPIGDLSTGQAMLRSVCNSFPYVRCFSSTEGWGMHVLASMEPMPVMSAEDLIAHMPESARADLLEWAKDGMPLNLYLQKVLATEFKPSDALNPEKDIRITDDWPYNEYFFFRDLIKKVVK